MKTTLKIVEDGCWNCGKLVKLPFVDDTTGPRHYKEELIKLANEHGATIKNSFSNMRDEYYNASVCPHCNAMFGEHYLVNYWYSKVIKTIDINDDLIIMIDGQLIY